jgi:hypothetical protein
MALVHKWTMLTERLPHVGEVSANFLWVEGVVWSAQRIPTAVNLGFLDRSRYFFIQIAPQLSSRGWVDTVPDPLLDFYNIETKFLTLILTGTCLEICPPGINIICVGIIEGCQALFPLVKQ